MTVFSKTTPTAAGTPIAVIGMAGFFARSENLDQYWRLIYLGEDGITQVPPTHWQANDYFDADPKRPDHVYCVRGGFIAPVAFDPTEFGIPPSNLEATDTSQLLGLLAAKSALVDAGYNGETSFDRDRASVILGVTGTQELVIPLGARLGHPIWRRALSDAGVSDTVAEDVVSRISEAYVGWQENSFPGLLGNVVAGRIANRLHLGGTNCVVDAACASSMSAINLAMLELESGRSDMVLTGGVDALNDIFMHMCFAKTMILSPTGDARPFSADADGTVLGEGVGIVVLKRLADAECDGDRIYAVLRGLGSSSDGKAQSIYAPLADGQAKALRRAYANAGVDPATVRLVETHGTGTRVGDAVEFSALRSVYEASGANGNRCAIGSVKSMIGHTKAAAGAAGLIKTILALHHKVIPPTLKVDTPDPRLELDASPFHINTASRPWFPEPGHPRRAGVSAFGFGGSNFHMVLEEYGSEKPEAVWVGAPQLAAFSGATRDAVAAAVDVFAEAAGTAGADLRRLCQERRSFFSNDDPYRLVVVVHDAGDMEARMHEARSALAQGTSAGDAFTGTPGKSPGRLAFLFPGQGSQYPDMGKDLVCRFPEAMAAVTDFSAGCEPMDLGHLIYPVRSPNFQDEAVWAERMRRTDVAQPAIGAVSLAMLSVLERFGVAPSAAGGHSFGEIAALHAAGVIDREAFIHLSRERGRCMAAAAHTDETGAMLAVQAPLETIAALIETTDTEVVLANRNSPDQGVVSGTGAAIGGFADACRDKGIRTVRLPVGAAFHSPLVAPALPPLIAVLENLRFAPPALPVYANLTGAPYPAGVKGCRETVSRQLISPVRFDDQVRRMYDDGFTAFVEVGPRRILSGLVSRILGDRPHMALAMDASGGRRSSLDDLARLLAQLAAHGHAVDLTQWDPASATARQPKKMSVPISGANVRPSAHRRPPQPAPVTAPPTHAIGHTADAANGALTQNDNAMEAPGVMNPIRKPAPPRHAGDPQAISGALNAVQEGIQALHALQLKTAETHQKFLETQAEAGQTLQRLMAGIQEIVNPEASAVQTAPPTETPAAQATSAPAPTGPPPQPATVILTDSVFAPTTPSPDESGVSETLFEVIAALTGYPKETLALEMDMERDLGIDSIKRVEILSAMEERLPHLPSVVPEEMVHLKSLGDIVGHLNASDPVDDTPAAVPTTAIQSGDTAGDTLADTLIAVVSTLTGYPAEMLKLDMNMASDLGIDSIKRVEILSEMEARLPALPGVHPEEMAALETLDDIVQYLSDRRPETSAPHFATARPLEPAVARPFPGTNDGVQVAARLIDIISELTGYPVEALASEMDLESDLGIDSIKRVEILSALEERLPDLPTVSPEEMGGLRTIGDIARHLGDAGRDIPPAEGNTAVAAPLPAIGTALPAIHTDVARQVLQAAVTPFAPGPPVILSKGTAVWIAHGDGAMADAMAKAFFNHGVEAVLMPLSDIALEASPTADLPPAAGLILLGDVADGTPGIDAAVAKLTSAFHALQSAAPHFTGQREGYRFVASVTRMDGRFGTSGRPLANPIWGGLAGLVKTARLEWPAIRCTAFDVCPAMGTDDAAARVVQELLQPDTAMPMEIGIDADTRWTMKTVPESLHTEAAAIAAEKAVWVVTGGARGITAEVCTALAQAYRPTLVLIGRSPHPEPEPAWLQPLSEPGAVKTAILRETFSGKAAPRQIEAEFQRHMANREVAASLAAVAAAGATVVYRTADVRDRESLSGILSDVRGDHGPIRAIIHAAGVLEDRLIVDKTREQVKRVLETKIVGFHHLDTLTADDPLQTLIVFSSVAARYGNIGQSDYAMANEALNKMARAAAHRHAHCRVAALNWGPWEGGMVTPALGRAFAQRGVSLIPVPAGAACMVAEMAAADGGGEIIYGSAITGAAASTQNSVTADASATRVLKAVASQMVDVSSHPILRHHILAGKPVVPFALITEWLGHSALHHNPGLMLSALKDIRLFHGIKIDHGPKKIRLMAGKIRKCNADYCVDVEIRNGRSDRGTDLIHASARAVLSEGLPDAPAMAPDPAVAISSGDVDVADLYQTLLFHGSALHGIHQVSGLAESGMMAHVLSAPKPSEWIAAPIRSQWIGDPLVMDAAFQMAIIWCRQYREAPCLPGYIGEYRQFCRRFPADGVTAEMRVASVTRHKFKAAFTFRDTNDASILASIDGFEATIDAGLVNAFKASNAA